MTNGEKNEVFIECECESFTVTCLTKVYVLELAGWQWLSTRIKQLDDFIFFFSK